MRTQSKILIAATAILVVASLAPARAAVTMEYVTQVNQTHVFRGNLFGLGLSNVDTVTVTDLGVVAGADGVFSGSDLDFVLLDVDGLLATSGDQTSPSTAALTPGTISNEGTSSYQPVAPHLGNLFGLNADDTTIDFASVTLGTLDASRATPLDVPNSNGWLSLGYGGSLNVSFPLTSVDQGLWVFVGEVGNIATGAGTESMEVCATGSPVVPAPGAIILGLLGTSMVGWLRRRQTL